MLAAYVRTDFLGWLRFPLWSGFEGFIIEQKYWLGLCYPEFFTTVNRA